MVTKLSLGTATVRWLAKALEDYLKGEKKDFFTTVREGGRSFLVQSCSNGFDRYLALVEYGGGGRRNFIFVLEEEGSGWRRLGEALWEFIYEGRNIYRGEVPMRPSMKRIQPQICTYREALLTEKAWETRKGNGGMESQLLQGKVTDTALAEFLVLYSVKVVMVGLLSAWQWRK